MTVFSPNRRLSERIAYLTRNNFLMTAQMQHLYELDSFCEEEIELMQRKKAMKLASFARQHSAFYQHHFRSANFNGCFEEGFLNLPTISRKHIVENERRFFTAAGIFLKKAQTSGTSGSPLSVYRSPGAIIRENAYVWKFRIAHDVYPGDPVLCLRPKLDRHTLYEFNKAENKLYLSCYGLSAANICLFSKLIRDFKPKAFIALPSSVFTLANLAEQSSVNISVPLVFTSSETLYPFQREKIESVFDTKIIDWYGNVERTIAMGQCTAGNYHEPPMYSVNEFQADKVITTSLINSAFPLIRYEVDDLFTRLNGNCKCGRKTGFSSIEGRYEDAVITPEGTHVNALGMAFRGIPHLLYSQIIQEQPDGIEVNLVTTSSFTQKEKNLLNTRLRDRLPESMQIKYHDITEEQIIKTGSGKFTLIISRLKKGHKNKASTDCATPVQ